METPSSSTRRVTRSQTLAANSAINTNLLLSNKVEESETSTRQMSAQKQQQYQDRSALIDITNDSPIVGLAMGNLKTPKSAMSKKRRSSQGQWARTPGSGEALLRGQVKTLLQKVEEEAVLSKITLENRPFINSPINIVAPTPANTPQIFSATACLPSLAPSPADDDDKFLIPQMMMISELLDEKKQEGDNESEDLITRSLLLDFSSDSSSVCSSVLTYQGAFCGGDADSCQDKLSADDDDASVWSIQVNASSTRDDEEECDADYLHFDENEEEEEVKVFGDENEGLLDELCEGINNISVKERSTTKFTGKHIRFVYNSDDEKIEGEEQVWLSPSSSGVLRLKGLPTPKGKHLRFPITNS